MSVLAFFFEKKLHWKIIWLWSWLHLFWLRGLPWSHSHRFCSSDARIACPTISSLQDSTSWVNPDVFGVEMLACPRFRIYRGKERIQIIIVVEPKLKHNHLSLKNLKINMYTLKSAYGWVEGWLESTAGIYLTCSYTHSSNQTSNLKLLWNFHVGKRF